MPKIKDRKEIAKEMPRLAWQTPWDLDIVPGEINDLPSETIPDQAMSMKEILIRYSRGLPMEGARIPVYNGEEDLPDPRTMELTDRMDYTEYAKNEIKKLRNDKKSDTTGPTPKQSNDAPPSGAQTDKHKEPE